MLAELGELGSKTGDFHKSVGRYAEVIEEADSLESLTGVVREMVNESRAVQSLVQQTQARLQEEHRKATDLSERVVRLEDEMRRLSDEVSTDQLTQIANRRGLMQAFEIEKARLERKGGHLSIGLLDIDNFKRLNDELGHSAGDEALKSLASIVSKTLRPTDRVARYGGEEFVVLLPETPADEGEQILTRLQRALQSGEDLLAFVGGRLGQENDEFLATIAGDPVGRPQGLADDAGERLQGFVAGAVAEFVVEPLEVVDVEQADREMAAIPLEARTLDLERLHQAAPIGDLRQLVGRDFVGEAPHLVLELDDALAEIGRLAVLFLQARLRLLHQRLHGAALVDHFPNDAGQALERIRFLDHFGVAADALVEVAGLRAELAELGQHLVDQPLQRVARLLALALDLGVAGASRRATR